MMGFRLQEKSDKVARLELAARAEPRAFVNDLAWALETLSSEQWASGDREASLRSRERGTDLLLQRIASGEGDRRDRQDAVFLIDCMVGPRILCGRPEEALRCARTSQGLQLSILAEKSEFDPEGISTLCSITKSLVDALAACGDLPTAREEAANAILLSMAVSPQYPQTHAGEIDGLIGELVVLLD